MEINNSGFIETEGIADTEDEVEIEVEGEKKANRCVNPKQCCCCIKIDIGVHLINTLVILNALYEISTYNTLSNDLTPVEMFCQSISIFVYCMFLCDK